MRSLLKLTNESGGGGGGEGVLKDSHIDILWGVICTVM